MEANNGNRAPTESRPPSAGGNFPEPSGGVQLPPRPPLIRNDSRTFQGAPPQQPQQPRQNLPPQQRPQFQPGGPISSSLQFSPRPGTPLPRGPLPSGPPGSLQTRPLPPPLRPVGSSGPQSFAPQQGPRLLQSPTLSQPPQRLPPPNNLQFGPRQPAQFGQYGGATTPDGSRPQIIQQQTVIRNGAPPGSQPAPAQIVRRPSQGLISGPDSSNIFQNKSANLDNPSVHNENQHSVKPENGMDMAGMAKARSYSIAAAPGAPSPLRTEDDRRKSISGMGGRVDDLGSRAPGLGLIQEGKLDNVRGSRESVRSDVSNDSREIPGRPESRMGGSKMTDSFISSQPISAPNKKFDDNDDVVLQNNKTPATNTTDTYLYQNKPDMYDRSPSLNRSSDESPELKHNLTTSSKPPQIQQAPVEPQRVTPKVENRPEMKPEVEAAPNPPTNIKTPSKSPIPETKPLSTVNKKPNELNTGPQETIKSYTPRKTASAPKSRPKDGDNDSGVDESTQGNDLNGSPGSPKKASKLPMKEKSSGSIKHSLSRSSSKSATAKTPENPPVEKKKLPMNKIQVGNAPSPNIKAVKSKIGSLENATYKPGGGKVKIENKKIELGNVTPRIAAKNDAYVPSGGTKKITTAKLEWNAKSKIGSLQNAAYKPGGGDKKIETVKLDFKEKAKPKVASTVNITHKPGGGAVKIENQKLEFKAQSKVGSMDNVKYKPGGGDIKIFDDKDYIKQTTGHTPAQGSLDHSRQEDYMNVQEWTEEEQERVLSRSRSARRPRPSYSPRRKADDEDRVLRNNERNRRNIRPMSARDPPRSVCSRRGSVSQRPAFTVY